MNQFHHIGIACESLATETKRLAALGYVIEGEDFTDPIQGVNGRFLVDGGPRLELLAPLSEQGCLAPWLKSGVKLYHLAYEVPKLENRIAELQNEGAKVVVAPVPAVAFSKRRIAFLLLRNMLLIELIEKE